MKKVFINSLPKSGTNLLAKCLLLFGYQERGHISAGTVLDQKASAFFRKILWKRRGRHYLVGLHCPVEVRKSAIDTVLRRVKDDQFLTGHVGYRNDLLNTIVDMGLVPVLIVRDPRAVLASFVPYVLGDPRHFLNKVFKTLDSHERFHAAYSGLTMEGTTLRPLHEYCLALNPWLENKHVFCIRFEDIVGGQGGGSDKKTLSTLRSLADVLDLPKNKIASVAEQLYGPGRHTFRKGQTNSWREELPDALAKRIAIEMADVLEKWDYSE